MLTLPVGSRDHSEGSADAAVTLVEYGDYECPHCGMAYPIVKEVQRRLGKQLRFVFRNFPIPDSHPHAIHAAEAAEAAAAQGHFWPMHDMLYEHQRKLLDRHLVEYAKTLGLDGDRFQREMAAHVHAPRVREDVTSGIESGVRGTPTFFINGVKYTESWDADALTEALENAVRSRADGASKRPARKARRPRQ
jgi:protein-disulfide isomerase